MAEDQQVEIELKAKDSASRVVRNIGKATGKLLQSVDKITKGFAGIMGRYGGIGAALSLGASVNSAKKYFDQISRIKNVAGGTAHEIASVRHAMVGAGVASADMESAYVTLAKKGGEMRGHMASTNKLARRMGVDFRKGPVEALVQMSKQVKAGKVGYKELNKLGGEGMLRMRKFLNQGPQVVRQQFAAAQKKMGHVNDQTMMQYSEFKKGVGKISQAWNRMVVIVGAKLLPILTKLMDGVASRIDAWAAGAAKFGDFLVKHMDTVVALAKVFGKVMMTNYALMKLTGKGLSGHMGGMVARAKKKSGGGKFGLANMVMGGGLRGKAAGGVSNMIGKGGKMGRAGAVIGKFMTGAMRLGPIAILLLKVAAVAAIIAAVVYGIKAAVKTMDGIGAKIKKLFAGIWDDVKAIGGMLADAFGEDAPLGKLLRWIGTKFVGVFVTVLEVVKSITGFIRVVVRMITELETYQEAKAAISDIKTADMLAKYHAPIKKAAALMDQLSKEKIRGGKPNAAQMKMYSDIRQLAKSAEFSDKRLMAGMKVRGIDPSKFEHVPGERPGIVQDFRGSRFDITQKFAEGFDPDRIAVAFANDLSNFGENKVQSALLSPFTVR